MKALILFALTTLAMSAASQVQKPHLNHIALYVADLSKSSAFYQSVMGLDSVPEPFKDGLHAWFKIGDKLTLHIIQGTKESINQYKNTHTCYSVNDINQFTEHLKQAGVTFEDVKGAANSITTRVDGVKQIYFKDPDGYWIEINNDKG